MTKKLIYVICPACKRSYAYKINTEISNNLLFENGLEDLHFAKNMVCEHEFIARMDPNYAIRDTIEISDYFLEFAHRNISSKRQMRDMILTKIIKNPNQLRRKSYEEYFIESRNLLYLHMRDFLKCN